MRKKTPVEQHRSADQNLAPAGMKGCERQAFVLRGVEIGSGELGFLALNHSVRSLQHVLKLRGAGGVKSGLRRHKRTWSTKLQS